LTMLILKNWFQSLL